MRVALIVNNPLRDLAGITLLGQELAARGAQVFLVPMALQRRELGALAPDFVLLNQLRPLNEPLVRDLQNAGVKVGVLDDEGGVFSSFEWYGRQLAGNDELRNRIDLFCAWGPRLAAHCAEAGWYSPDAIAVTGHPRFDFSAPQLRNLTLPDAPDASKFSRPMVLINSRFSRANPAYSTPTEEVERLVKSRGFSPQQAREFQDQMLQTMRGLIELTNQLAARLPDVTFVFRPHPFEKLETYRELLTPRANLHLNREGEIGGWLAISDAVIHRSCTTAIEAGMRGVPAISPAWLEMPDTIESTEIVSMQYPNVDAIENAITALQENKLTRPTEIVQAHEQVVQDWFGFSDGLSHRRVADAILACGAGSTSSLNRARLEQIFYGAKSDGNLLKKWRAKFKNLRRDDERVAQWKHSEKFFNTEKVRAIHTAMTQHSGSTPTVRVVDGTEGGIYARQFEGQSVAVLPTDVRT